MRPSLWPRRSGPLSNAPIAHAREKYDEIKAAEAPHFPAGEQSVTEQWERAGGAAPAGTAALHAVPTQLCAGC